MAVMKGQQCPKTIAEHGPLCLGLIHFDAFKNVSLSLSGCHIKALCSSQDVGVPLYLCGEKNLGVSKDTFRVFKFKVEVVCFDFFFNYMLHFLFQCSPSQWHGCLHFLIYIEVWIFSVHGEMHVKHITQGIFSFSESLCHSVNHYSLVSTILI